MSPAAGVTMASVECGHWTLGSVRQFLEVGSRAAPPADSSLTRDSCGEDPGWLWSSGQNIAITVHIVLVATLAFIIH